MKKRYVVLGLMAIILGFIVFGIRDVKWKKVKRSVVQTVKESAGMDVGPDKSMRASTDPERDERAKEELGYSLGMQAYIYGIPSLRSEEFRYKISESGKIAAKIRPGIASENAADGRQFNEICYFRVLANPDFKVGFSPNNDTMYGAAAYNVKAHPIVLTVPEIKDRYYSVQITDINLSNVAYLGTRATNSRPGNYILTGPDWKGDAPADLIPVQLTTNEGMVTIRILVDGEEDVENVVKIQDRFKLVPLPKHLDPNATVAIADVPKFDMSGELHQYRRIVEIAQRNPPRDSQGRAIWQSFAHIGMSLDKPFKPAKIDTAIKRGMKRALKATADVIAWKVKFRGYKSKSMWNVDTVGGSYHQDYLARAEGAIQGLLVHDPEEAMYFHSYHDSTGEILNGDNQYTMHFDNTHLPPVAAFWSLTAYDEDYNLVDNPIKRYSIGDRTKGLKYGDDGSLTLYVQSKQPKEGVSNWLPTPAGEMFRLNFRMYMPDPVMRDKESLEDYLPPLMKRN